MNKLPGTAAAVDLARTPDFDLGPLHVSPSSCRVGADGRDRRVEPLVMQVLVVLATAGGRTLSRGELIEACWGGRFVSDDSISRAIAQVRSLARGVEPAPFVVDTIPKVGFRLRPNEAAAAPPPRGRSEANTTMRPGGGGRPGAKVLGAAAVVVVVGLAVALFIRSPAAPPTDGRVEVTGFKPLQREAALDRYATALGDAVARMLVSAGVETTQGRPTAGGGANPADLRVAGTVDRDGSKYVVNAQVVSQTSQSVLWSARFDRDASAPVGFQEEAANRIGDTLRCALWHRHAERRPMDEHAFSLLLEVCAVWRGDPEPLLSATEGLAQATPGSSYAHSLRAIALALAASRFSHPSESDPTAQAAEREARRALELDPQNAEAYQALAIRYFAFGHWLERERYFVLGGKLPATPPSFYNLYVETLREVGRWRDATALNRRTVAADPFSPYQPSALAILRAAAGDLPEAELLTQRAELLDPAAGRYLRATIAFWWREPKVALATLEQLASDVPPLERRCEESYLNRLTAAANRSLRGLPRDCETQPTAMRVRMLAREGDVDGAYAAFAQDPDARYDTTALFYPEMDAFRRDARFLPLAARVGLLDYWRKSGQWPDFCRETGLPYRCV